MKEKIKNIKTLLKIDLIGFTKLDNYYELENRYNKQKQLGNNCSFQVGSIYDKTHLKDKYNEYNSFIVVGICYNNSLRVEDEVHFSSFCWGNDYHEVLYNKLEIIGKELEKEGYKYKCFVDNNILDERYIAFKAGLGFYGKNNLLINEKIGSNFFIGVLMTDCVFEYDKEVRSTCLNCDKCINSCPTKTLSNNNFNSNMCLSYITQKKNITEDEKKFINKCIYGCDICSNVCPYNINKKSNNFTLDEKSIIKNYKIIDEDKWNKYYKNSACYWRGKEVVNRNIKLAKEVLEKK